MPVMRPPRWARHPRTPQSRRVFHACGRGVARAGRRWPAARKAVVGNGAHVVIFGRRVCSAIRMRCSEPWSGGVSAGLVRIFVYHSAQEARER